MLLRGPSLLSRFMWFVRYLAASGRLGSFPALRTPVLLYHDSHGLSIPEIHSALWQHTSRVLLYIHTPEMHVAFLKKENFAFLRLLLIAARFEYVVGTVNGCLYSKSITIRSILGQGGQGQLDLPSSMALHCLRSPIALSPPTATFSPTR